VIEVVRLHQLSELPSNTFSEGIDVVVGIWLLCLKIMHKVSAYPFMAFKDFQLFKINL
jgi:hypothetical protein